MRECRFYPWCSYIEDHGCTKDSCRHYQPMPDVAALLALADEMGHPIRQAVWNQTAGVRREHIMAEYARRIREACGEVVG